MYLTKIEKKNYIHLFFFPYKEKKENKSEI